MKREEIIHTWKPKIIAEVGVLRGRFATHLLSTKPNELHLIDPWKYYPKSEYVDFPNKTQEQWDQNYEFILKKFKNNPEVKIHRMESVPASKTFPDGYFDLVYIDANHAYEYVLDDIKHWLPKVKKGGIIAGHDACWHEVAKAVKEIFGTYNITSELDNVKEGVRKYPISWYVIK